MGKRISQKKLYHGN